VNTAKQIFSSPKFAWLFLGILVAYLGSGAFPIVPIEGDDSAFAVRVQHSLVHGIPSPGYLVTILKGAYVIVEGVARLFSVNAIPCYGLLTLLAAFLFLVFASIFISRITSVPSVYCGFALLLFPRNVCECLLCEHKYDRCPISICLLSSLSE